MLADKVLETTITTGTGTYSLGGAPLGYRTFVAGIGTGKPAFYCATSIDGTVWEIGYGTVTDASPDTLARNVIRSSSGTSAISWSQGTKYIYSIPVGEVMASLLTTHRGTTRPGWLQNGGMWIDSADETLYWYDGTADREIGAIVSNKFVPYSNGLALTYAEGSWTPALTFATPGNLSIVYATQEGHYTRIGRTIHLDMAIVTSTFTHTTASGNAQITGLPFTVANDGAPGHGILRWGGITKANFTDAQFTLQTNSAVALVGMSGSGQTQAVVQAADMPTGGTVVLRGSVTYRV